MSEQTGGLWAGMSHRVQGCLPWQGVTTVISCPYFPNIAENPEFHKHRQEENVFLSCECKLFIAVLVAQSCLTLVRLYSPSTPWTVACQGPPSMGFSSQGYRSGLPFPSPEDLPDLGIKAGSSALQADSLLSELRGSPLTLNCIPR